MKYLVMENRESYSMVMDENGIFYRAANLGYEIGDVITEPVFMKTPEKQHKRFNWKKVSSIAAIFVCMLMASIPFINNFSENDVTVYMSINPEVAIQLDRDGKINKVVAGNDDGKILLKNYKFRGKNILSVLTELIDRAEEMEFLSEGGDIRITVESQGDNAEIVSVDLGEFLKDTYVKKYMIKIRVNQEQFCEVEQFVALHKGITTEATEEITETEQLGSSEEYIYNHNDWTAVSQTPTNYTEQATDNMANTEETSISSESSYTTETSQTAYRSEENHSTETKEPVKNSVPSVVATEQSSADVPVTEATAESVPASKPTVAVTENTEVTESVPTEEPSSEIPTTQVSTTEAASSEETSGGTDDDTKDDPDDDLWPWWPWWPWQFTE